MPVQDRIINICLCCDDKYVQHLAVTMASILKNKAPEDLIRFCILDGGISHLNKEKIRSLSNIGDFDIDFIEIDSSEFASCKHLKNSHRTLTAYYRLLISDLKPQWGKIIYLDCDIIVKSSLKELFCTDLCGKYAAMADDISSPKHKKRLNINHYYNSGVIVFDTQKWTSNNITAQIKDWIENNIEKIKYDDQDAISAVLGNYIYELDKKWNAQVITKPLNWMPESWENANILHFIDKKKPWKYYNGDKFTSEYLNYLRLTPFKGFLLKYYTLIVPISLLKKFAQIMFSVTNERGTNKKIIRILGLKFSIDRTKQVSA